MLPSAPPLKSIYADCTKGRSATTSKCETHHAPPPPPPKFIYPDCTNNGSATASKCETPPPPPPPPPLLTCSIDRRWMVTPFHTHFLTLCRDTTESDYWPGPCLPTFSDESAPGLALLAEAAAKKADTTKTQLPPSLGWTPRQIRPYDPAAKLPSKLLLRIENLEFIEIWQKCCQRPGHQSPPWSKIQQCPVGQLHGGL